MANQQFYARKAGEVVAEVYPVVVIRDLFTGHRDPGVEAAQEQTPGQVVVSFSGNARKRREARQIVEDSLHQGGGLEFHGKGGWFVMVKDTNIFVLTSDLQG